MLSFWKYGEYFRISCPTKEKKVRLGGSLWRLIKPEVVQFTDAYKKYVSNLTILRG